MGMCTSNESEHYGTVINVAGHKQPIANLTLESLRITMSPFYHTHVMTKQEANMKRRTIMKRTKELEKIVKKDIAYRLNKGKISRI